MSGPNFTPVARSVPLDNATNGFDADKVQTGLEEIDFRVETKEPTGWTNIAETTIAFNESTRRFTVTPTGASFHYLIRGHRFEKLVAEFVDITDTDGLWHFFYLGTSLTTSQTPWTFTDPIAFIATVYWDKVNQKATLFEEERHGLVMDWGTHHYLHYVHGLIPQIDKFLISNYILRGDGSLDAHAQVAITNLGMIFDEDLSFTPVNSATPVNPYEQKLSAILWAPVLYRSGVSGVWTNRTSTAFALPWTAGSRASYNQYTGATWQLTVASEGYFFNTYLCFTNDARHPVISIVGQSQYVNVVDAAAELFRTTLTALPVPEIYGFVKLVWKTSTSYANQPKAVLFAVLPIGDLVIDNDRYTVELGYNGNAGVGKYLDRAAGASSVDNPFVFPESSFIRWITLQCQKGSPSTGTVGIFKSTDLVNPVISISLAASEYIKVPYSQYFAADDQIAYRVTAGSINKPYVTTWIQTQLG